MSSPVTHRDKNWPLPGAAWPAFVLLATAFLVARWAHAQYGALIWDEYQHLHSAYLVSQGQVPYRDFFEHHTPLLYYVLAAILPLDQPSFETMIQARYASLVVHLVTIGIAVGWVWRMRRDSASAWLTLVLMFANVCLFTWGTRTYLDTWAVPFLLLTACTLPVGATPPWRPFVSGLCFTLACLTTQKAVFAGPAIAAALLFRRRAGSDAPNRSWWHDGLLMSCGALPPLLFVGWLLGFEGITGFVRDAVLYNLRYRARHFPTKELLRLAVTDGPIYFSATWGIFVQLSRCVRRRLVAIEDLPTLFLVALSFGILLMPVVWEEYMVLLLPFAIIVAAHTLLDWWRRYLRPGEFLAGLPLEFKVVSCGLAAASLNGLISLKLFANDKITSAALVATLTGWLLVGIAIAVARRGPNAMGSYLWLALLLVFPVVQQLDWTPRHTNFAQRARVDYIMNNTTPEEKVFDGFSGWGVFRRHAYRYWFLNDEIQLMLNEQEKTQDIIDTLSRPTTKIAVIDEFVRMLPPIVVETIKQQYQASEFPEIWVRKPQP